MKNTTKTFFALCFVSVTNVWMACYIFYNMKNFGRSWFTVKTYCFVNTIIFLWHTFSVAYMIVISCHLIVHWMGKLKLAKMSFFTFIKDCINYHSGVLVESFLCVRSLVQTCSMDRCGPVLSRVFSPQWQVLGSILDCHTKGIIKSVPNSV